MAGDGSNSPKVVTRQLRAQVIAACEHCSFTEVREAPPGKNGKGGGPVPFGTVANHLLDNPGHEVREVSVSLRESYTEVGGERVPPPAADAAILQGILSRARQGQAAITEAHVA